MTPRTPDPDPRDPADEAVSRLLDRVGMEEPPADLKDNVLRAIGTRPEPARSGWLESLRAGIRRRLLPPLAPFAAGAVAGVLVFALASDGGRTGGGGAPLEGVMAPLGGSPAERGPVDDQRFELGRANVRFEAYRPAGAADRAVVAVTMDAVDPLVVTMVLAPGASRVERLVAAPSGPASEGVDYGPHWVRIRHVGRGRVEIRLAIDGAANDPIAIAAESGGTSAQGALRAFAPNAAPGVSK